MELSLDHDDPQAFEEIYNEYADAIFRHCYFRIRCRERGKELMQEAFMQTWKYLRSGKKIDNIRAFLYKTANNLVIDDVRKNKKRQNTSLEDMQEEGFDPSGEDEEEVWQQRMDAQSVLEVLEEVDQPYRDVLIMRFVNELSPAEISEALGETANVISVRIHRAEKMLRAKLAVQTTS